MSKISYTRFTVYEAEKQLRQKQSIGIKIPDLLIFLNLEQYVPKQMWFELAI